MILLPKAPTTEYRPHAVGKVDIKEVKLPHLVPHSGAIGNFTDEATIRLVKPTSHELHPPMPMPSHVKDIEFPTPTMPKNLQTGLKAPATKSVFGMIKLEKHPKRDVPIPNRG